jgi:hypothetical protein
MILCLPIDFHVSVALVPHHIVIPRHCAPQHCKGTEVLFHQNNKYISFLSEWCSCERVSPDACLTWQAHCKGCWKEECLRVCMYMKWETCYGLSKP